MNVLPSESQRIQALDRYAILDTPTQQTFDDLVRLAALICETPIALVSLVAADRQWFKARVGLEFRETPREHSFCHHAIQGTDLFAIPDTHLDSRFQDNPIVTGDPLVRFYAGVPLMTEDGHALGTICVLDRTPRQLTDNQRESLEALSRLTVVQFELHRQTTEMLRSEQNLRTSEERLALVVEGTLDGVWDWDIQSGTMYYSPRFRALIRQSEEWEPIPESWESQLHPEDRAATIQALTAHLEDRRPYDVEYRLKSGTGEYRWFRARGQAQWNESGQAVRMIGSIADISEQKEVEQHLRLLKTAIDNANDAILITEAEPISQPGPRVVYANKAFTQNTGYSVEEILGKTPRILQGPETSRETLNLLRKKLQAWKAIRVELLNYKKDGTEFWVELNIRPVADAKGVVHPLGFGAAGHHRPKTRRSDGAAASEQRSSGKPRTAPGRRHRCTRDRLRARPRGGLHPLRRSRAGFARSRPGRSGWSRRG